MARHETLELVKQVVKSQLGQECDPESTLYADLGIDSLDLVEIVMELEDQIEAEIPDHVAEGWITVQDVANYIDKVLP